MQTSAFTLTNTNSIPNLKPPLLNRSNYYYYLPSLSKPIHPTRKLPSVCCSSSPKTSLGHWLSTPEPQPDAFLVVKAASDSSSSGDVEEEAEKSKKVVETVVLGSLFGLWYLFNIYFNIYNKQVLKVYPNPITVTTVQFAVGSVIVFFMWTLNLHKRPKISGSQLLAILPLALVHTLGNLFTNMSLGKVAVSFTHTIKAMEPFFSVVLSAMFLGEELGLPQHIFSLLD